MQKLFYFILRWVYRALVFLAFIITVSILADENIAIWIKAAVIILLLLMLTIPESFPRVFKKAPKKVMSGIEYEQFCAKVLARKGFRHVQVTPPTGDYGADLIAVDKRGKKWVVQCKHYTQKVGNSAVQEIVAAKAHYGADKAAVMTNSQMTSNARKLAIENDVTLFELIDD